MDRRKLSGYPAVGFVIFGFLAGFAFNPTMQTLMGCPCELQQLDNTTQDGEIPCNSVSTTDYIFFTGIFNVYQEKEGQEIIMCEDGERVGEEVRYDEVSDIKVSTFLN